jgi:L,D-peptidoglycan transpeptidase YkuD (ErfK/YbiS/YcfS/YnhG family)
VQKLGTCLAILSIAARAWGDDPAPASGAEHSPVPAATRQLLLVRSASWKAVTATLQRFERSPGAAWQTVGAAAAVNVGRKGMAWGRGLHAGDEPGPVKKEGDERSPAGAFALGPAFGYKDVLPDGAKRYPYVHVRRGISCIEDSRSKYYNQVIDPSAVANADWAAKDEMLRPDGLFRWGVIIEQNAKETVRGAGSCVFLHIWKGLGKGTAGCTAMPVETVEETIRWLDPSERPVLVQLPESEYTRLRAAWALP